MPRVAKVRNGQVPFQVTVHQGRKYCGVRLRPGPMDRLARGARRAGFEAAVRVSRRSGRGPRDCDALNQYPVGANPKA